ncbi:hypothetical protein D3C72_1592390 [compost metagenome]
MRAIRRYSFSLAGCSEMRGSTDGVSISSLLSSIAIWRRAPSRCGAQASLAISCSRRSALAGRTLYGSGMVMMCIT